MLQGASRKSTSLLGFLLSLLFLWLCLPAPLRAAHETVNTCVQPPANVDLTTVSAEQLARYGLPAYTAGLNRADWAYAIRNAHYRSCTLQKSAIKHTPTTTHSAVGNDSINWAGGIATGNGGYNFATSRWRVPCLTTQGLGGSSAVWVGLGGVNNNHLVQTGTEQEINKLTSPPTVSYRAWVENLAANNPFANFVFPVNCGDQMTASVYANGKMFIEDLSTGRYATQTYGPAADTSTADYILERGYSTALPDFHSVILASCQARQLNNNRIILLNQAPHQRVIMKGLTGAPLATANDPDSTGSFTITWKQAIS